MVQEFHVIRCCTCRSFQVQQVKKVKKWSCKLCGQKQSLLKEFGRGSGADCRRHVQKLNAMRGAMMEDEEQRAWSSWEEQDQEQEQEQGRYWEKQDQESRWTRYLTHEEAEPEPEPQESEEEDWKDKEQHHGNSRKRRRPEESRDGGGASSCSPEQKPVAAGPLNPVRTRDQTRPSSPPSSNSGSASMWDCFLYRQEESVASGRGQCSSDVSRPRLQNLVAPLFESGEDFDDFL